MYIKISKNIKTRIGYLIVLTGIVLAIFFSLASGNHGLSNVNDPNVYTSLVAQKKTAVERQILTSVTQVFQPSLETKENMDFLLTPALLMQEAMSQDTVITYPTE